MRIKTKDLKAYRKAYYLANREKILKKAKEHYKRKMGDKCKCCGADIKKLKKENNGNLQYCNKCMADNTKVSRQARWYRRNSSRLKLLRKLKNIDFLV